MKNKIHIAIALSLFLSVFQFGEPVSAAQRDGRIKNILILHSYNQGYSWTDEEMNGINSVLKHDGQEIELHITYMDAKRLRSPESDLLLSRMLALKMTKLRFSGVIVSDNDAFEFVRNHRKELFKDIPVVFCGINDFTQDILADWPTCTGVVENQDYKGACEIGLSLFPAARKVFVISDDTTTGRAHFDGIAKIKSQLTGASITCWNFSAHPMSDTLREVGALAPDSIILLLSFFRDGAGEVFSMEDAIAQIMDSAEVPVFTGNNSRIMYGVLGGKVVDGRDQGACAANMMKKILNGTPVSSIPVETDMPTRYSFDYQALIHFQVPFSVLPLKSMLLHKPPPFYSVDKSLFYAILTSIALLLILVLVLTLAILQKRRGGRALCESEEKFRTLFEQAAVGVAQADSSGKFIKVNKKFAEMLGYAREEMEGMSFQSVTAPECLNESIALMCRLMDGEIRDFTVEKEYLHKGGGFVWALVNVSLFRPVRGSEICLMAAAQDITERKKLEEHLIRSEKLSAVGQLAAGVAHEFNNVLMVIKSNIQLASNEAGISRKEMLDMFALIDKQVDKGRDVVSKIMSFAKPKPLKMEMFRLKDMVYEVIALQVEQMRLENIAPVMEIPEELEINADRDHLQQVLVNMFLNARHAIYPKKFGQIKVSAEHNDGKVSIRVTDNGVGMNEQTKKKIFLPFFTTKGAFAVNTYNIKGAGLGLPVCSNIIQLHGGHIFVESKEGVGTTFTIVIPDIGAKQLSAKTADSGANARNDFSGLKILVVDDEPDICVPLSKTLNFLGCRKTRATVSPFEALNLIQADPPDLIFLDVLMSGMSGMQLLERISNDKRRICVIMMSGKLNVDVEEFLKAGASGFLQKPFGLDELLEILEKVSNEKENMKNKGEQT
jgi:PAS domain S-box-containing protein